MVEAKNHLFQNRAKQMESVQIFITLAAAPNCPTHPCSLAGNVRVCQSVGSLMLCSRDKRIRGTKDYDKEHGGDVISFLTHVCAIWWLDGCVRLRLHLHVCVCVCWEEDDFFFMAVQRLFDVPVAALAVPGPRLGNSEWQRENSRRLYAMGAAILL